MQAAYSFLEKEATGYSASPVCRCRNNFRRQGPVKRFKRFVCHALSVAAVVVLTMGLAVAQQTLGTISGTVTDSTGAAINGATVTMFNTDRGSVARTVTTSGNGFYTATALPLGGYRVTVSASGFGEQVLSNIVLHVNDSLTINSTLKVGAQEKITVTTEAQGINIENAT